jgi:alanyl-tRNA synthetase
MKKTSLLYLSESDKYKAELDTVITAIGNDGVFHWVELPETILHVKGGGQPPDGGTINASSVVDVRCVDNIVRHYLEKPIGTVGDAVEVLLDRNRRELLSRWHSAGHLVACVIEDMIGVEFNRANQYPGDGWVSAESSFTPPPDLLPQVNAIISNVILKGLPISITEGEIRKVTIHGYRSVPCGGTHISNTANLNGLVVTRISSKKGILRASFDFAPN